jgi:hypothetical protein
VECFGHKSLAIVTSSICTARIYQVGKVRPTNFGRSRSWMRTCITSLARTQKVVLVCWQDKACRVLASTRQSTIVPSFNCIPPNPSLVCNPCSFCASLSSSSLALSFSPLPLHRSILISAAPQSLPNPASQAPGGTALRYLTDLELESEFGPCTMSCSASFPYMSCLRERQCLFRLDFL